MTPNRDPLSPAAPQDDNKVTEAESLRPWFTRASPYLQTTKVATYPVRYLHVCISHSLLIGLK